jgi:hypothetical protein
MLYPEQYRQRAKDCVELAQNMREPERQQLLSIAEAWLRLADETAAEEHLLNSEQEFQKAS